MSETPATIIRFAFTAADVEILALALTRLALPFERSGPTMGRFNDQLAAQGVETPDGYVRATFRPAVPFPQPEPAAAAEPATGQRRRRRRRRAPQE